MTDEPSERTSSSLIANSGGVQYFYDAQNKRVWQATCLTGSCTPRRHLDSLHLPGQPVRRRRQAARQLLAPPGLEQHQLHQVAITFGPVALRSYFGGRLVAQQSGVNTYQPVIQDRLGSVGKYYPYGEERNSPQLPNDQVKFATYTRDSATGNDYADQRYYTSVLGRFMTADASSRGFDRRSPSTWNRYSYVLGDPINHGDPSGTDCTTYSQYDSNGNLVTTEDWGCTSTAPEFILPDPGSEDMFNIGAWVLADLNAQISDTLANLQSLSSTKQINVSNYSTTSLQAIGVQNSLRWLKEALKDDSSCSDWLSGNQSLIATILGDTPNQLNGSAIMMVGVGNFDDNSVNAVAGSNGTNLTAGTAGITINVAGAFFSSSAGVGYGVSGITGGSDAAKALILLHELAHLTGAAGFANNDAGNVQLQTANNQLIQDKCGATLQRLK